MRARIFFTPCTDGEGTGKEGAARPRFPSLFLTSKILQGHRGLTGGRAGLGPGLRGGARPSLRAGPVPGLLRRPREARRGRPRPAAGRRELPGRLQPPRRDRSAARCVVWRGEWAVGRRAERGSRCELGGVSLAASAALRGARRSPTRCVEGLRVRRLEPARKRKRKWRRRGGSAGPRWAARKGCAVRIQRVALDLHKSDPFHYPGNFNSCWLSKR